MPARRLAALAALLVALPAFAGCADDADDKVTPGATRTGSETSPPTSGSPSAPTKPASTTPKIKSPSEKWHFHDYWGRNPTITLLDANLTLTPTVGGDGLPALSALVELPQGTLVPPETGHLTLNVTWNHTTSGLLNLSFRPADSNDFLFAGDLAHGTPFRLNTTESMCDVPHRQQSFWRFNLTAKPGGTPPAAPPKDFRLVLTATIGRPLFIDAPHVNWWQPGDVIPLVQAAEGTFQGGSLASKNVSLPGAVSPTTTTPAHFTQGMRVPASEGRIVPEGTKSVVVMLNWSEDSAPPGAKLKVRWKEGNSLSEGLLDVAVDGAAGRIFTMPVTPGQTDTTYSNRTTWEFQVVPDSDPAAFRGSYTFHAWASRLEPAAAVAMLTAAE